MTKEEAQEYAKTMTYSDAIYNLMQAKSIPYRKATFVKITELLKALEQESKTGHWIEEDMFDDIAYRCSECNEVFCLIDGTPTDYLYNYCPNCGAKMSEIPTGSESEGEE